MLDCAPRFSFLRDAPQVESRLLQPQLRNWGFLFAQIIMSGEIAGAAYLSDFMKPKQIFRDFVAVREIRPILPKR